MTYLKIGEEKMRRTIMPMVCLIILTFICNLRADIKNWQTGETIPGTANITPEPGIVLRDWNTTSKNLKYADLANIDLSGARLWSDWLHYAKFTESTLTNTSFSSSNLTGADFTDAIVNNTSFSHSTGFTKEQLYTTANYKNDTLGGVGFANINLTAADFSGKNLTGTDFYLTTLVDADMTGAQLLQARLYRANLTGTVFTNADITQAELGSTTSSGFTQAQLYSTANYQNKDLSGIDLRENNLSGWNFSQQNLTNAKIIGSTLINSDFSEAVMVSGSFSNSTFNESNMSNADMSFASFSSTYFTDVDLRGANLTHGGFNSAKFIGADLTGADLTNASLSSSSLLDTNMTDSIVKGANFGSTVKRGFTNEQLYSTASYQEKDLNGIQLYWNDLSGWNFSKQYLVNSNFNGSTISGGDFSFADLRNAVGWTPEASTLTRNTIRPDGQILSLNLASNETLVIRNFDMDISVKENMSLADSSILQFALDGNPWNSTMTIDAGIIPILDGSIELLFAEDVDYNALIGTTYDLFNWNGSLLPGQEFGSIITLPGLAWDTSNLYTTGEVTLIPEPTTLSLLALGAFLAGRRRRTEC